MEVLPFASVICPAGHASHAPAPASALYKPAGQAAQASGGPEKPGSHSQVLASSGEHTVTHAELSCAPSGEVWPVGQSVQAPALA